METIIYLAGNGFRLYIISRLFQIFLNGNSDDQAILSGIINVDGSQRGGGGMKGSYLHLPLSVVRACAFFLYYLVNSLGFLVFSWNPGIMCLTNLAGALLAACTYEGKWKQRILAVVMAMALSTICEDLVCLYPCADWNRTYCLCWNCDCKSAVFRDCSFTRTSC